MRRPPGTIVRNITRLTIGEAGWVENQWFPTSKSIQLSWSNPAIHASRRRSELDLKHPPRVLRPDRPDFVALARGRPVERNRRAATRTAKAGIGDELALGQPDHEDHVAARRGVGLEDKDDPCGSSLSVEAERAQGGEEKRGLLEAIAAALLGHDLLLQAVEVEPDRAAEQDVEILERNGVHVCGKQAAERGEVRLGRTAVADSSEVGVKIEGVCMAEAQFSISARATITRMISFVPSRIWCTRRSRTSFSTP